MTTDSERFYHSILDLFDEVDEKEEVNDLLTWWNRYAYTPAFRSLRLMPHFKSNISQLFVSATSYL